MDRSDPILATGSLVGSVHPLLPRHFRLLLPTTPQAYHPPPHHARSHRSQLPSNDHRHSFRHPLLSARRGRLSLRRLLSVVDMVGLCDERRADLCHGVGVDRAASSHLPLDAHVHATETVVFPRAPDARRLPVPSGLLHGRHPAEQLRERVGLHDGECASAVRGCRTMPVSLVDLLSAAVLPVESVCSGDVRLCGEHCGADRRDHAGERVSDRENTVAEATSKDDVSSSALEVECAAVICGDPVHHLLVSVDGEWRRLHVLAVGSVSGTARRLFSLLAVHGGHVSSDGLVAVLAKFHKNTLRTSIGTYPSCKHSPEKAEARGRCRLFTHI